MFVSSDLHCIVFFNKNCTTLALFASISYFFCLIVFQCRFDAWLMEKEEMINTIQNTEIKDQNEKLSNLRKLAVCILKVILLFYVIY